MLKKSWRNTLIINIGAFVLVLVLELLSGWLNKDGFDSNYDYFMWAYGYAINIMIIIWINHFVLIPFLLDKKRYVLYVMSIFGIILLISVIKGYKNEVDWYTVTKYFFFFMYATGSGMAAYFLRRNIIFQRERAEKEQLQKEMELTYLKEQVNPHFLFNSLNSIYSLSRQQSPETPDLVMQLSELLRYQLESAKKDSVLLKEEIEFIENYLLLEEKRLSSRCAVDFQLEGEVSNLNIAPMLLIPFVENAIKHGAQSTNEQSKIDVTAVIRDRMLHFAIVNTKPTVAPQLKRKGLGLGNVKRRLNLLYPNNHTLEIEENEKTYLVRLSIDLSVQQYKR